MPEKKIRHSGTGTSPCIINSDCINGIVRATKRRSKSSYVKVPWITANHFVKTINGVNRMTTARNRVPLFWSSCGSRYLQLASKLCADRLTIRECMISVECYVASGVAEEAIGLTEETKVPSLIDNLNYLHPMSRGSSILKDRHRYNDLYRLWRRAESGEIKFISPVFDVVSSRRRWKPGSTSAARMWSMY